MTEITTRAYPELAATIRHWGGCIDQIPNGPHSRVTLPEGWVFEQDGPRGTIRDTLGRERAITVYTDQGPDVSIQLKNWFSFDLDTRCWTDGAVTVKVINGNGYTVLFASSSSYPANEHDAIAEACNLAEQELMKLYPDWSRSNMIAYW